MTRSESIGSFRREALILGLVSLAGPLATSMYVPAFPVIAAALGASSATIELSLVSYLAALALGQNVFGPLSDRLGRNAALYAGFGIFIVASAGASFSTSAEHLIVWRFLQGLGGCAAMAVPRAIIRDRYTGSTAVRMMSLMVLVLSGGVLIAPMIGTGLAEVAGWRSIFWCSTAAGIIGLALVFFCLPETLPAARRVSLSQTLRGYGPLLHNRRFMWTALMVGFAQAIFFVYLAGSPFVFMSIHGLEAWQFSLVLAIGALAWSGFGLLSGRLMDRFGVELLLRYCVGVAVILTIALFALAAFDFCGLPVLIIGIVLVFAAQGIMMPAGTVLALHPHRALAGTASAIVGTAGFSVGAIASMIAAATADGTELPLLGTIAACALLSATAARIALK